MSEEPVVILTGPRTVGKSTLLAALAAEFDRPVLDLDRPDARAAAASDPGFIVSGPGPVLIDEFQHVPEILDAIKAELNTDTRPGRYVLTGSTRYSVEVKAGSRVQDTDLSGLRLLRDRLGERFIAGFLLNLGGLAYRKEERILVMPLSGLWSLASRPSSAQRSARCADGLHIAT
jgi:hypothetical protein